jgi:hypothetical protein
VREKDVVSAEEERWVRENTSLAAPVLLGGGIFFYPFFFLLQRYQRRRLERRVLAHTQGWQQKRLLEFLDDEGVRALASTDARRVEVEQRFWREEQVRAVSSLRGQFSYEPAPLSLRAALMQRVRARGRQLRIAGISCGLLYAWVLLRPPEGSPHTLYIFFGVPYLFGCILGGLWLWVTLAVESVTLVHRRAEQRRLFTTERHRIVEMVELSGGLTLAESMDDVLFGALSAEVARGGELEQVEGR